MDIHITQVDDFIPLRHIGQRGGVDLVGIGRDSNLALAGLDIILNVPIVDANFLGVGSLCGGTDLDKDPAVVDVHITQVDDFIALRHIGQRGGVDLVGIGGNSNLAFAGLDVVLNVPVVDADFLSGGNGLHLNPDPAAVDSNRAGRDQLVAFGNVLKIRNVDRIGVGIDGNLALASLFVVHDVPVVDADFLSGGLFLQLHIDPAVSDSLRTRLNNLIAVRNIRQIIGVDLGGIEGHDHFTLDIAVLSGDVVVNADVPLNENGNLTFLDGQVLRLTIR